MQLSQDMFDSIKAYAIVGDEWTGANAITKDTDTYTDSSWPGCDYRYQSYQGDMGIACNLVITGRKSHYQSLGDTWKTRVKIDIVGDGEPSTFFSGWLFHKECIG